MVQNEAQLWKYLKKNSPNIRWTRLENTASLGTPDLLAVNKNNTFFTVELKVTKRINNKLSFSPHQLAFHIKHPQNTFILAMQLLDQSLKLYEGNQIEILATRGMKLEARCEGLANCIGKLEAV